MHKAAAKLGIYIGATAKLAPLKTDSAYTKLILSQYDLTAAENACKQSMIAKGFDTSKHNYDDCKFIADWTKTNNMAFRGHVLVWPAIDNPGSGDKVPKWIQSETDMKKLETWLLKWIPDTIKAVGTWKVVCWDVVNEIVPDGTNPTELYKDTVWTKIPDFFCKSF